MYNPTLKEQLTLLTTFFVTNILKTLRETSLEDLLGNMPPQGLGMPVATAAKTMPKTAKPRKPTKRFRRTSANIATTARDIVSFVTRCPNVGAEAIRQGLGIKKHEWLQPIALALTMGLKKKGEKRATVYFVGSAKGTAKAPKHTVKKHKATKTTPAVVAKPRTKRASVVAAGDASSPTPETTETNGTSTQVEVHPVLTSSPS